MVTSLARQAVIIKSGNGTSILTGNYELAYALGFLANQAGLSLSFENPDLKEIRERMLAEWKNREVTDEKLEHLLRMVKLYDPSDESDGQMQELLGMGLEEKYPWDVHRG